MPSPAAFPSRLACTGQTLTDANGYVMPQMRGFNVNPSAKGFSVQPVAQDYVDMYSKGARYIRAEMAWEKAQPTNGTTIDATWQSQVDTMVTNCVSAGLYVWFNLFFQSGSGYGSTPAWAQTVSADGKLQNYVANGQYWTQWLANRYGNPTSPQYTPAVMGCGINEPAVDFLSANNWITNHVTEQVQMATWARAVGYAPNWIVSIAAGPSSGTAMVPNATGSGQTGQTFTSAVTVTGPTGSSPLANHMLEVHDPVKVPTTSTSVAGFPANDGRNATYGGLGSNLIQIGNTTHPGYVPVFTGITQATCQAGFAAWWATYIAYANACNCPIFLAEANWDPVVNNSGPGGASGLAYISDKMAQWTGMSVPPVLMSVWEYHTDQASDHFAVRPGTGAGIVGADSDGWLQYANAFMSSSTALNRVLQRSSTWYRRPA